LWQQKGKLKRPVSSATFVPKEKKRNLGAIKAFSDDID
jgi:hypothetical protein